MFREWSRLSLTDGVLYRNTNVNNVQMRQLVLQFHFRTIVLKQLAIRAEIRLCLLLGQDFIGLA